MTRWMILGVLVVALTATTTVVVQTLSMESPSGPTPAFPAPPKTTTTPQPRVVVDGDLTYNFGTKAQLLTFSKDWLIRNEGKGPLTLELEAPACSCTVAVFQDEKGKQTGTKMTVPPGGETPIHFTWQTRTYSGKYRKPATILTNDLERPKLEFAAAGEVQPAVVVYPRESLELMDVSTDEESHHTRVALYSPDRPDFKITKITSSNPELLIATQSPFTKQDCKELKAKGGHRIDLELKRGLPLGAFVQEVVVETDHPSQPNIRLTVSGKMVGPITVVPSGVNLTNVSSSDGQSKTLRVIVRGNRPTKFEVVHKPDKVKVAVAPGDRSDKPSHYLMTVTVPPGVAAGTVDDLIVVRTDHPHASELRIPVNLIIRDPN